MIPAKSFSSTGETTFSKGTYGKTQREKIWAKPLKTYAEEDERTTLA